MSVYLSVTTCAVIGQFSGPYSTIQSAKFKAVLVAKMICDLLLSVIFLWQAKVLFSLNCVLKH